MYESARKSFPILKEELIKKPTMKKERNAKIFNSRSLEAKFSFMNRLQNRLISSVVFASTWQKLFSRADDIYELVWWSNELHCTIVALNEPRVIKIHSRSKKKIIIIILIEKTNIYFARAKQQANEMLLNNSSTVLMNNGIEFLWLRYFSAAALGCVLESSKRQKV